MQGERKQGDEAMQARWRQRRRRAHSSPLRPCRSGYRLPAGSCFEPDDLMLFHGFSPAAAGWNTA